MLNPWVMFLVGLVLGWLLTWLLQRRLDDSLTAQVAQLQRELSEANRRLGEVASAPIVETAVQTERASAAAVIAAVEKAEQLAPPSEPAYVTPEGPGVVEAAAEQVREAAAEVREAAVETWNEASETATEAWDTAVEAITEQPVVEEARETVTDAVDETVASIVEQPAVQEVIEAVSQTERAAEEWVGADDLTIIRGIGPKFAETLHAAGITTFAALAKLTPEELEQIIKPAAWQKVDFAEWIAQASERA